MGLPSFCRTFFGKDKNTTCLIYGVASFPLGAPVALKLIFEVS